HNSGVVYSLDEPIDVVYVLYVALYVVVLLDCYLAELYADVEEVPLGAGVGDIDSPPPTEVMDVVPDDV
ncbi:ACAD11, partial [Symbiodinium microadriaticum]